MKKRPVYTHKKFRRFEPGRKFFSNLNLQLAAANLMMESYMSITRPFFDALMEARFGIRRKA